MSQREIWALFIGIAATSLVLSIAMSHTLMIFVNGMVLGIDIYMFRTSPKEVEGDNN